MALINIIGKTDIIDKIKKLNRKKAIQDTDTLVKILKENTDFFAELIYVFFNESIKSPKFPSSLKLANITPVFKMVAKIRKQTIDQIVFPQ